MVRNNGEPIAALNIIAFKMLLKFKLGFIIIDFWSACWHEPIKNKNENGIFGVVFRLQKWTSIFEFWRLSKTVCHFFLVFGFFFHTTRNQKEKKRHFCFCFRRPHWNDLSNIFWTVYSSSSQQKLLIRTMYFQLCIFSCLLCIFQTHHLCWGSCWRRYMRLYVALVAVAYDYA